MWLSHQKRHNEPIDWRNILLTTKICSEIRSSLGFAALCMYVLGLKSFILEFCSLFTATFSCIQFVSVYFSEYPLSQLASRWSLSDRTKTL
jgi:hypothetical protein